MDSLASEFQISKKTIYKYFPSKENIVEEIVADVTGRVSITVDRIIKADLNAVGKLAQLLHTSSGTASFQRQMAERFTHTYASSLEAGRMNPDKENVFRPFSNN